MRKAAIYFLNIMFVFLLSGCGKEMNRTETEQIGTEQIGTEQTETEQTGTEESETAMENILPEETAVEDAEENSADFLQAPSKDEVLAMREKVLKGMSQEETDRLKENIKVANLQMESAYLNENIFDKLSHKDSVYWQYFDQTGDIQLGWWYEGNICSMDMIMRAEGISEEEFYKTYDEPGMVFNRFDAGNFIDLMEDMMESVHDENLSADLRQLADLADLAAATHDVQYANEIYKILHDMDYFLLRYGMEDVGKYTRDKGTVAAYYGVLNVYGGKAFSTGK